MGIRPWVSFFQTTLLSDGEIGTTRDVSRFLDLGVFVDFSSFEAWSMAEVYIRKELTPWKINSLNLKNGWVGSDDFPDFNWVIVSVPYVNLFGV